MSLAKKEDEEAEGIGDTERTVVVEVADAKIRGIGRGTVGTRQVPLAAAEEVLEDDHRVGGRTDAGVSSVVAAPAPAPEPGGGAAVALVALAALAGLRRPRRG